MKKYTLLLLAGLVIYGCAGTKKSAYKSVDERDVPERYVKDFHKRYADVKNVKWEMADSTLYFANFKTEDNDCIMKFTRTSTEMMYVVPMEYLPSAISDYVKAEYPEYKIHQAYITDIKNQKSYLIPIEKAGEKLNLQFDLKGNFNKVVDQGLNPLYLKKEGVKYSYLTPSLFVKQRLGKKRLDFKKLKPSLYSLNIKI